MYNPEFGFCVAIKQKSLCFGIFFINGFPGISILKKSLSNAASMHSNTDLDARLIHEELKFYHFYKRL